MIFRTGRLPHDPARLATAPRHTFGATLPPRRVIRPDFQAVLGQNDVLSDCTVVCIWNHIEACAAVEGYGAEYVDPTLPIALFGELGGNPSDLTTIPGLVFQDVVDHVGTKGFNTGHDHLYGFPGVVENNRSSIAQAIDELRGCGLGVEVHQADEDAVLVGRTVDVLPDMGDIVGRHALFAYAYDGLGDGDPVKCVWWGRLLDTTWRWIDAYTEEVHALRWPQLKAA